MDYEPISGFSNRDMKCKYCVDITLKVVGIVALTVFVIMTIVRTMYVVKMYNRVYPLIGLIESNIKNITSDINSMNIIFKLFTAEGLEYIKVMADDLNKIADRIG